MNLGPAEIALIVLVILLLFGAKKLPDAARSIGRSMRIFKSEVNEMKKDGEAESAREPQQQPAQLPPNPQVDSQGYVNNTQFYQPGSQSQPYPQQGQQPQQPTSYHQQYPQHGQPQNQ